MSNLCSNKLKAMSCIEANVVAKRYLKSLPEFRYHGVAIEHLPPAFAVELVLLILDKSMGVINTQKKDNTKKGGVQNYSYTNIETGWNCIKKVDGFTEKSFLSAHRKSRDNDNRDVFCTLTGLYAADIVDAKCRTIFTFREIKSGD